jgi:hypothetical protein
LEIFADPASARKPRLLASVDVKPWLAGKVYSHGVLNIVKALTVWDDVVETADRATPDVGKVLNKTGIGHLCGRDFTIGKLLKVAVVVTDGGERQVHMWTRSSNPKRPQNVQRDICKIQPGDHLSLSFESGDPKEVRPVELSELRDYVPAW